MSFSHYAFIKDFRKAELADFPDQRTLETPLDESLWLLWVMREEFDHNGPMYASEIAELAEIRSIALSTLQVERSLARAGKRVLRKKLDFGDDLDNKTTYKISEKGILDMKRRYAVAGARVLVLDGSKPWTDRHLTLPQIAAELEGRICVVDKFYGSASLGVLSHFKHGSPLQFLTGKTNESSASFARELKDFKKEVRSVEVRLFPAHHELHDRYIISDNALVIVGHGIKDIGDKESFLVLLKGEMTTDLRKTLLQKFESRWSASAIML